MPTYEITADVTVSVAIEVEADDKTTAQKLFHDKIVLTATLVDLPNSQFSVNEDSISDVENLRVEAVD